MGLMVDTNVFIRFEKANSAIDLSPWSTSEKVFISVVTASELLIGVHRAINEERRLRRSIFVEAVISGVEILDFTIGCARRHAEIYADLTKRGEMIGAHDLIIAATASYYDLSFLTENVDEFSRVPDLSVIPFAV
ncbi:type II toxin-antitoxin system VapC family toxin [Planctomicrobium piriforme]|uniref:Ribonuclease VapC n=1 Tax=Planctomicrobium piriforme TaxID=1576369 RepID=A0A1I3DKY5_9PLAN|nr:type II toxin-antitoxin system VapC family toxin [Planctomicrobium piriforme]SFH87151.1 hypothetical protein/tRNA(fMet)-specific endonuclease VapC [Planctomicrobium piriforme]